MLGMKLHYVGDNSVSPGWKEVSRGPGASAAPDAREQQPDLLCTPQHETRAHALSPENKQKRVTASAMPTSYGGQPNAAPLRNCGSYSLLNTSSTTRILKTEQNSRKSVKSSRCSPSPSGSSDIPQLSSKSRQVLHVMPVAPSTVLPVQATSNDASRQACSTTLLENA